MDQLNSALEGASLEALWVSSPENVRYLSGFTSPQDGKVLYTPHGATLFTDARYEVQAQQESRLPVMIWRTSEEWKTALRERMAGVRLGFEAAQVTVATLGELEALRGIVWTPSVGLVEALRVVKTPEEIRRIRQAAQLTDTVLAEVLPMLEPGVRELDVALELEFRMRRAGADGVAFEIIVASGPRSAMPHGVASARRLEAGDLVTIDLGARVEGYCSDMTRAYPVGEIPAQLTRLYRAVAEAKRRALEAVRPGMGCKALDAVARDHLRAEGFESEFAHSLGHGVGLAIHEEPRLSYRLEQEVALEVGNVITIEPGLYLPGVGGVRLEDLVVVTNQGCEVLSRSPQPVW